MLPPSLHPDPTLPKPPPTGLPPSPFFPNPSASVVPEPDPGRSDPPHLRHRAGALALLVPDPAGPPGRGIGRLPEPRDHHRRRHLPASPSDPIHQAEPAGEGWALGFGVGGIGLGSGFRLGLELGSGAGLSPLPEPHDHQRPRHLPASSTYPIRHIEPPGHGWGDGVTVRLGWAIACEGLTPYPDSSPTPP